MWKSIFKDRNPFVDEDCTWVLTDFTEDELSLLMSLCMRGFVADPGSKMQTKDSFYNVFKYFGIDVNNIFEKVENDRDESLAQQPKQNSNKRKAQDPNFCERRTSSRESDVGRVLPQNLKSEPREDFFTDFENEVKVENDLLSDQRSNSSKLSMSQSDDKIIDGSDEEEEEPFVSISAKKI